MSHPTKPTDIGNNRTGIETSMNDAKKLEEGVQNWIKHPVIGPERLRSMHEELSSQAPPVGTMPPNGKKMKLKKKDNHVTVFLDKLGERIAFERSGVRLYEALLVKLAAAHPHDTGINRAEVEQIRDEELRHFGILVDAAKELGVDPTVMTSSADVVGVASSGIVQVLTDSRTTLSQCLEAILVAEHADNEGWELLIQLADGFGLDDCASKFRQCLEQEKEHVEKVRTWLVRSVSGQAGLPEPQRGQGPQVPAK